MPVSTRVPKKPPAKARARPGPEAGAVVVRPADRAVHADLEVVDAESSEPNPLGGDVGPEVGPSAERDARQVGGAEGLGTVDLRLVVDAVGGQREREALLRGAARRERPRVEEPVDRDPRQKDGGRRREAHLGVEDVEGVPELSVERVSPRGEPRQDSLAQIAAICRRAGAPQVPPVHLDVEPSRESVGRVLEVLPRLAPEDPVERPHRVDEEARGLAQKPVQAACRVVEDHVRHAELRLTPRHRPQGRLDEVSRGWRLALREHLP